MYYWVVCNPHEKPDGPADLIGPYTEYEAALFDLWLAMFHSGLCPNKHFIGSGREIPPQLEHKIVRDMKHWEANYNYAMEDFWDHGMIEVLAMIRNSKVDKNKYIYHEIP